MFSTAGCGYCTKARKFLTKNQIPFTELDVEDNPTAPGRLSTLGQKAGLSARDLQGVPIIFVDGKPILGWDERRLSKMLGLGS
jgi:glutaredoxin